MSGCGGAIRTKARSGTAARREPRRAECRGCGKGAHRRVALGHLVEVEEIERRTCATSAQLSRVLSAEQSRGRTAATSGAAVGTGRPGAREDASESRRRVNVRATVVVVDVVAGAGIGRAKVRVGAAKIVGPERRIVRLRLDHEDGNLPRGRSQI